MTRLINSPTSSVTEAMDGALIAPSGASVMRLDGFPHIKVAIRADASPDRVAVISGGGSGHEPAHIGFVGRGMLTAAVAGEVFASPSVDAVLAGILAVTGPAGCLLVVKNYTGDRLNFGLAAERAKQMGLRVEVVIVADDVAIPSAPQARGIAGTLFVHKVAGYAAERGDDLASVKAAAETVARNARSIGLSVATCDLPGQPPRSAESSPELGLGIHGEPGVAAVRIESARQAVGLLVERLTDALPDGAGRLAVLINNLGSVTPLEMSILTRDLVGSEFGRRIELLVGPGAFMTSLNMYGFSLSTVPLSDDTAEAIAASVGPVAWLPAREPAAPQLCAMRPAAEADQFAYEADPSNERLIRAACGALIDAEESLNGMDAKVGDGDTGTTAAIAARSVLARLEGEGLPLASPATLLLAIGQCLSREMGGASGVLLSIFFTTAGNSARDGESLLDALLRGVQSVSQYGGAKQGDRTMLDSLLPALKALKSSGTLGEAAVAARAGAEDTRRMQQANAGRSAYLQSDLLAGNADPGAAAVALVFEALA